MNMRVIQINHAREKDIHAHGSRGSHVAHLLGTMSRSNLVQIRMEPEGLLGMHQAFEEQLFIVIQGTGLVRSEDSEPIEIGEGDIVFWQRGEMHETASGPDGLKAIVLEGPSLGENLLIG